jgi:hypothetical protein
MYIQFSRFGMLVQWGPLRSSIEPAHFPDAVPHKPSDENQEEGKKVLMTIGNSAATKSHWTGAASRTQSGYHRPN